MISVLLLCVPSIPCALPAPSPAFACEAQAGSDVEAKIAAAGKDIAKLLELAASYAGGPQQSLAEKVYRRVLELDTGNAVAHKALRHQLHDGKWFDSFAELAKYKREEDARMGAKGLARFKEQWVPAGDVPFLKMEWTKDGEGAWANPVELARRRQIDEWESLGHQFRADDNSWIAPDDVAKWTALLWKCGEEWLDIERANAYHSTLEHPWQLAGEHCTVWATCDWDGGNQARWHAEKLFPELVRLFGIQPREKPHFVVLNSLAQYNQAAGNQGTLWESEGFSSLHGAYFADCFFDFAAKPPQYQGCGVSYWDRADPRIASWGPYWLRWAAAQSFVDAIDPSWGVVSDWIENKGKDDIETFKRPFWSEKRIPRWLRYGAAAYVERFMRNPEAAEGSDPWSLRNFAFAELKKSGGLRKLDDVFALKLDTADIPGSNRLYYEAGLLVAFLLDGADTDKELAAQHQAFQAALKSGARADVTATATALQKSLATREREIKKFAGL